MFDFLLWCALIGLAFPVIALLCTTLFVIGQFIFFALALLYITIKEKFECNS